MLEQAAQGTILHLFFRRQTYLLKWRWDGSYVLLQVLRTKNFKWEILEESVPLTMIPNSALLTGANPARPGDRIFIGSGQKRKAIRRLVSRVLFDYTLTGTYLVRPLLHRSELAGVPIGDLLIAREYWLENGQSWGPHGSLKGFLKVVR